MQPDTVRAPLLTFNRRAFGQQRFMLNAQCDVPPACAQVLTHRILVIARRLVIDRTFRFYAPRTALLRETVRLDALPGREHSFYAAGADLRQLEAISSHRHVVLHTKCSDGGRAEHDRIVIKAKSAARAAQSEMFYVTLYTDARQAVPTETWQINVHWLHMHDVTAVLGQDNVTSVVLKGHESAARNVALHCSHPDELLPDPDRLVLPKATHVEVMLHFRPLAVGSLNMVLNIVEQGSGSFVDALLICTHARAPHVSRTFEVNLPAGTVAHKKARHHCVRDSIGSVSCSAVAERACQPRRGGVRLLADHTLARSNLCALHLHRSTTWHHGIMAAIALQVGYRNMYHQRRKFILRSSNPSLVSFASHEVSVPALEQRNLGLQVSAVGASSGMKHVLVFINDEEDRNEECYKVRVHVYKPER
jgi:hypothetical protein